MKQSLVLVTLVVLALQGIAQAQTFSPQGRWSAADGAAIVEIAPCGGSGPAFCATVIEERLQPGDEPLLGTLVLQDLRPGDRGRWTARYTPGGENYPARVRFPNAETAEFEVCVLWMCDRQTYRRVTPPG